MTVPKTRQLYYPSRYLGYVRNIPPIKPGTDLLPNYCHIVQTPPRKIQTQIQIHIPRTFKSPSETAANGFGVVDVVEARVGRAGAVGQVVLRGHGGDIARDVAAAAYALEAAVPAVEGEGYVVVDFVACRKVGVYLVWHWD